MRANNIIPCLDSVAPNLTFNKDIEDYANLKEEFLAFPNVKHDDFVDNVIDGVKIGLFTNDPISEWDNLLRK
jgi:phage terminase large subunit-like protein